MGKRILVIADMHCGHLCGLTPPRWQVKEPEAKGHTKRSKFAAVQREAWAWYVKTTSANGPYDVVIVNGDCIDGRGLRSGATELITADRQEQVDMAEVCIQRAMTNKTKLVMSYGTPYHTGDVEDFENDIAKDLGAVQIGAHDWIDANGLIIDYKHFIGGSSIPHGRYTAISRDALWSALWAERGKAPSSDILIRSHVHYYVECQDATMQRIITPALQAMGSKYGSRRCSGTVDFGVLLFEVDNHGGYTWDVKLADLQTEVSVALRV